MLSLLVIILIIPTMIVIPFNKSEEEQTAVEQKPIITLQEEGDQVLPVSVAVMREDTKEEEDIPLEEYVVGVVASEMYADFEVEALKAQSVAARTYIVNHLLSQEASVSDTVNDQVYRDETELRKVWGSEYNKNIEKIMEAVSATAGEIVTYNDLPIFPAYFSTSNGYTENSEDYWSDELPYLRSVKSPWDEESPKFLDQQVYSIQEVAQALGVNLNTNEKLTIETTRTDSQRVKELSLSGHSFSGKEIREKLGLQSSDFTIEQNKDHLVFTTKGFGHGIGMSQFGANGMAKEGKDYQEIVQYYYQDVEISSLKETVPTLVSK